MWHSPRIARAVEANLRPIVTYVQDVGRPGAVHICQMNTARIETLFIGEATRTSGAAPNPHPLFARSSRARVHRRLLDQAALRLSRLRTAERRSDSQAQAATEPVPSGQTAHAQPVPRLAASPG